MREPNTERSIRRGFSIDESLALSEIEPSFPYRDVTVRRGVEFKDDYDIQAELGR